ncbi:MAG: phosphatidylglycerophosphatase A [Aeromonadaceae bacterium]|nr:phosphatidylglycerophosphatase A [Aeromonadaceae bacterium]
MIKPELKRLNWRNPLHWLATGFGAGLSPVAPGTVGTLAAVPCYYLVSDWPLWAYLGLLLIGSVAGIWICQSATEAIGQEDHGGIVWDEFMGYGITMIAAPAGWFWLLAGFLLFRLFDILKPWPIGWLDRRVKGGLGIMVDDLLAGVMAWWGMQVLAWGLH